MIKVVETTQLYKGKYSAVREIIEREDGKRFPHETISHPGAVVILPLAEDGRILLIRQYRHSIGRVILEAPAGTLEKGEDPAYCAGRELSEEINFGAHSWTSLGQLFPAPGFCNEVQHLFFACDLFSQPGKPDDDEEIVTVPITIVDLEKGITDGTIDDSKTISAFARARLLKLL